MKWMFWRSRIIVTIPVKNEQERIGRCLAALAGQLAGLDQVLLLLNNCTDGTLEICRAHARKFGKTKIIEQNFSGARASAGEARRVALTEAAKLAGDGILLTTDADAVPGQDWVAQNLDALARGADVVCGRAVWDAAEMGLIPAAVRRDEEAQAVLLELQDEIAAMVDPDGTDPWPRHQHHSGASLALRAAFLRKAGGAPSVAVGEDRALVERLRLVDARIRHAPEIAVSVSGRLEGRAEGGMAATLKRRLQGRDLFTDDRLEPTVDAYRRVLARQRLRAAAAGRENAEALAEDLLINQDAMRQVRRAPFFGAAWAALQRLSPVLRRRRLAFADLPRELEQARTLRNELRRELHPAAPPGYGEKRFFSGENAE